MTNSIKRFIAVCAAGCITMMQGLQLPARAEEAQPDFSAFGAVGIFTEEETEKLATVIYDGLVAHSAKISLRGDGMPAIPTSQEGVDSLGTIFRSVVAGWDAGLLTNKNSMPYYLNSSGVTAIAPNYLVDDASYDAEFAAMTALMDEAVSGVQETWSKAEKALYIHDWMADHYSYDDNSYETTAEGYLCHTAYGMLKRDMAVCEGYAWLYTLLLRRVGVDSIMVTSEELLHAWNLLEIDGSMYHVDVTWDDLYDEFPGRIGYSSFLKSNEGMEYSNHYSTDWETITGVSVYDLPVSDKYDYGFWNNSTTTIEPFEDGSWIAVYPERMDLTTGQFTKCIFDPETAESESSVILSHSARWGSNARTYIVTEMYEGTLYYTTPRSIFALRDGVVVWLFDLPEDVTEEIYGMYIENGVMHYFTGSSPVSDPEEYTVDLADYQQTIENAVISGGTSSEEETTTTTTTTTTETTTTTTTTTTTSETTTTTTTTTTPETTTTTETTTTAKATTTKATTKATTTKATTKATTTKATTKATTTKATTKATTTKATTKATTTKATTKATTTKATTKATTTKATTKATTTTKPAEVFETGDFTGDGELNILDVISLQQYLLGKPADAESCERCDLTDDGSVDAFDLAVLKKMLLAKA